MKNLLQQRKNPEGRGRRILLLTLFVLVLTGDAFAAQEVLYKDPRPMKEIFQAEAGGVSESGTLAYFYNPVGKTDPFKSFIAEEEEMESKRDRKPRTYLETLDLSQLQLIAIMVGPKGRYAMGSRP